MRLLVKVKNEVMKCPQGLVSLFIVLCVGDCDGDEDDEEGYVPARGPDEQ